MLGMVVPDNRNLYFAELARSVEDACFERGYNVILCNSDGAMLRRLVNWGDFVRTRTRF